MIAIPARLAIVLAIVPLVLAAWVLVGLLRDRFPNRGVRPRFCRRRGWLDKAVASVSVAIMVLYGGAKNGATNAPPQGASNGLAGAFDGRVERVDSSGLPTCSTRSTWIDTPLPLFRLESESTNWTYSYAMPTNGARYDNWWIRGAYEDVFRLDLDGMLYPLGTNLCDSFWVYTWGMIGARLDDVSNRLVAADVPMSAVPQVSQFWSAETDGGGRLLTWQDFALDRDTNTPVSVRGRFCRRRTLPSARWRHTAKSSNARERSPAEARTTSSCPARSWRT